MYIHSVTFREYVFIGPGKHTQRVIRPTTLEAHTWGVIVGGTVLVPWAMVLSMEVQEQSEAGVATPVAVPQAAEVPLHPAIQPRRGGGKK
jgi:hypothetical protein